MAIEIAPKTIEQNQIVKVRPKFLHSQQANILSISEQRILMYSIYKFQRNSSTVSFTKSEMEDFYGVKFGFYQQLQKQIKSLAGYGMEIQDQHNDRFMYVNTFEYLKYDQGIFEFKFTSSFLPQIEKQRERFIQLGMYGFKQFRSLYSLYLYDWIKEYMWAVKKKENIGSREFKAIFNLTEKDYEKSNSNFRKKCWEIAMNEINEKTGYKIQITSKGRGSLIKYSITILEEENFKIQAEAENLECKLGKDKISYYCHNCMFINKCKKPIDYSDVKGDTMEDYIDVLRDKVLDNREYSYIQRKRYGCADKIEEAYHELLLYSDNFENH